jgi:hypothetical protein
MFEGEGADIGLAVASELGSEVRTAIGRCGATLQKGERLGSPRPLEFEHGLVLGAALPFPDPEAEDGQGQKHGRDEQAEHGAAALAGFRNGLILPWGSAVASALILRLGGSGGNWDSRPGENPWAFHPQKPRGWPKPASGR